MSFKIDICDLLGKPLDYVKAELIILKITKNSANSNFLISWWVTSRGNPCVTVSIYFSP